MSYHHVVINTAFAVNQLRKLTLLFYSITVYIFKNGQENDRDKVTKWQSDNMLTLSVANEDKGRITTVVRSNTSTVLRGILEIRAFLTQSVLKIPIKLLKGKMIEKGKLREKVCNILL